MNIILTCTACNKVFKTVKNLEYHTVNKVCEKKKYICKYCNNKFTSRISMYRHIRMSCKVKTDDDNKKKEIYNNLVGIRRQTEELRLIVEKEQLEIQRKKMLLESIRLDTRLNNNDMIGDKNQNRNINIINSTININNNIVLVGCGKEDMSRIDKNDIIKNINGFYTPLNLTDTIHFNPKYPEYHNVYISSMKDKYAMIYDGDKWSLVIKDELIDKLYDDKKNYIEENFDDFLNSLTKSKKNALERWMNIDDNHEKIKEVKNKMKLLLYNKRNIPIDAKNKADT